jgi:hypothetical protein
MEGVGAELAKVATAACREESTSTWLDLNGTANSICCLLLRYQSPAGLDLHGSGHIGLAHVWACIYIVVS